MSFEDAISKGLRRGLSGQTKGPRPISPELLASERQQAHFIARRVAAETGIPVTEILGQRRWPEVARARRLVMVGLWREGWTLSMIGRAIGRDHSTVISGLRRELGAEVYDAESAARVGRREPMPRRVA